MESIRLIIRHLLEAAVASKQAAGQNLALLRRNSGKYIQYILYDPQELENEFTMYEKGAGDEAKVIYGFLEVRPHDGECWNAAEIAASAAKKGYGPLMYELAMSDFENGLMPDRSTTSPAARKVWQVYTQRSDVSKFPLDDKRNPKTPPKIDDCSIVPDVDGDIAYLNQAYVGRGDTDGKSILLKKPQDGGNQHYQWVWQKGERHYSRNSHGRKRLFCCSILRRLI